MKEKPGIPLCFAHISDTHLPGTPANAFLERICREFRDPWENLRDCLRDLAAEPVDFILHAGDAVHEGSAGDYIRMRNCFAEFLPGVPVVTAPGNHDRREAFRAGMPGMTELSTGELVQEVRLPGKARILVLDTTRENVREPLSKGQTDWLEARLSEPAEEETLLLMHHPLACEEKIFRLPATERLEQMIAGSGVRGIFSGHTHRNRISTFLGKPCCTADSLAVGMRGPADAIRYTSFTGYQLCRLEAGVLSVENRCLTPKARELRKKRQEIDRTKEL